MVEYTNYDTTSNEYKCHAFLFKSKIACLDTKDFHVLQAIFLHEWLEIIDRIDFVEHNLLKSEILFKKAYLEHLRKSDIIFNTIEPLDNVQPVYGD